jgi:sugar lactone lactonase YvrE
MVEGREPEFRGVAAAATVAVVLFASAGAALVPRAPADTIPPFKLMWGKSGTEIGQFGPTYGPRSVALDDKGNVYVVDRPDPSGNRVQVFDPDGKYLRHFMDAFNNGSMTGITLDEDGNVFLVNNGCSRIEKYDNRGNHLRTWGWGVDGGSGFEICTSGCQCGVAGGGAGQLQYPWNAATDDDGNLYVGDAQNDRVVKYDNQGNFLATWGWGVDGATVFEICTSGCQSGIKGSGPGQFDNPYGIAVVGSTVYVADALNARIQYFNSDGSYLGKHNVSDYFSGLAVTPEGHFWVTYYNGDTVALYSSTGVLVGTYGGTGTGIEYFDSPRDVAAAPNGDLFFVDGDNHRIKRYGPALKPYKAE